VRACRPPEREPSSSRLARRSTMATSTPANANSPASISPVGPAPAIATACPIIATPQSACAFRDSRFRRSGAGGRCCDTTGALRQAPGDAILWRWQGAGCLPSPPHPLKTDKSSTARRVAHSFGHRRSRAKIRENLPPEQRKQGASELQTLPAQADPTDSSG